jgi:hypothetical protein
MKKRSRTRGASHVGILVATGIVVTLGLGAVTVLGNAASDTTEKQSSCLQSFSCADGASSGGSGAPLAGLPGGSGGGSNGGTPGATTPGAGPTGVGGARPAAPASGGGVGGFFRDVVRGATLGDYAEGSSVGQTIGQIGIGLVPFVGQAADVRDFTAAARDVWQGRQGGWLSLAVATVAFVPLIGDGVKVAVRGGREAMGEGAQAIARRATEVTPAVRAADDAEAGLVGAAGRRTDDASRAAVRVTDETVEGVRAAYHRASQWADDNWDRIAALPPGTNPALSYSGFSGTVLGPVMQGGLLSGRALGRGEGVNASNIWWKRGEPFYMDGPTAVIPTTRLEQLGGQHGVGLAGQPNVVRLPHEAAPGGVPASEFAIVVPAGNGYVIPVYIPPGWTGPSLPIAPGWVP